MNYGIGKMRPCGHSHFYKYAHCVKSGDPAMVCRDYKRDLTEDGEFIYNLDNIEAFPSFASQYIKKFSVPTPKLYSSSHAFSNSHNLVEFNLYTLSSRSDYIGAMIQIDGPLARKFTYNFPNFEGSISSSCQQISFANGSEVRVYAPKISTVNSFFDFYGKGYINHPGCIVDFYAPSATNGSRTFYGNIALKEVTYQVYPISGNHVFGEEPTAEDLANVDENGDVIIEKRYSVFPKLSTAENMFLSSQLNKDYVLAFINALENTYTDSKSNHPIYFGIHVDHAYDDELALALKTLDNDYVTISEHVGRTITATENKGWSLSVGYNGTLTDTNLTGGDEPIRRAWIDDDSIVLPAGYTRCEYLEDTGTQWIDTGYVPQVVANSNGTYTATTGLYAIAKQITHAGDVHCFGSGYYTLNTGFTAPRWLKSTGNTCGFSWKTWNSYGSIGNGSAFESKLNFLQSGTANLLTNYGKSYSNTLNANLGFSPTLSLYLFSTNVDNTSPSNRRWKGRIYRAKISEGTEIVRDFVPCLDADGVPCMYDILESNGSLEADTYYNANPDSTFLYKLLES